jgi:hypothetical protein
MGVRMANPVNMGDLHISNLQTRTGSPLLTKLALGKISTDLALSENLRNQFIQDPVTFVAKQYGNAPTAQEAAYFTALGQQMADGLCCKGCGCGSADIAPDTVVLPAAGGPAVGGP